MLFKKTSNAINEASSGVFVFAIAQKCANAAGRIS
jgi:hypothetical protein